MRPIPLRSLVLALCALFASGCLTEGVGDPCLPEHPLLAAADRDAGCPLVGDGRDCFGGSEVYIEARSLQCRTRVCLVYHYDERDAPDTRGAHAYCTRRCAPVGSRGDCPEGFTCEEVFPVGDPGVRGAYCVRQHGAP